MSENAEQLDAIYHSEDKHLAIIAGPGSGKTRVIVKRLSYLVEDQGIDPSTILLVTYTNRAINEIVKRINVNFRMPASFKYAGTLHSISKKLLEEFKQEWFEILGKKISMIDIFDDEMTYYFVANWWHKVKRKEGDFDYMEITNFIFNTKFYNYVKDYEPYRYKFQLFGNEKMDLELLRELFLVYDTYLRKENKFDFADLIIWFHQLLIKVPHIKKICQERFRYIMIDEFQDINKLQLEIIKELSGDNNNIFCVGDPNQAIYSFQGAYPDIFKHIEESYKDKLKIIYLYRNYRSSEKILGLSNYSITKNISHFKKDMFTSQEGGNSIKFLVMKGVKEQYDWLQYKIKEILNQGYQLKDIAILYRNKYHVASLKKYFCKYETNLIDFNDSKPLTSLDTQLFISIVNFCFNKDEFALRFVISFYVYGNVLDSDIYEKLDKIKNTKKVSLFKALDKLSTKTKNEEGFINNLRLLIDDLYQLKDRYLTRSFSKQDLEGFIEIMKKVVTKFDSGVNWHIATRKIKTFYSKGFREFYVERSLKDFFELLLNYVKNIQSEPDSNHINFSTIHGAKGCEFEHVFVSGLTENKLPSNYAVTNEKNNYKNILSSSIEEERRIFYVATTRAKQNLYLMHIDKTTELKKDHRYGKTSRFVQELTHLGKSYIECYKLNKVEGGFNAEPIQI